MRYKNTKTGAIIDSSFKIVGKYWQEFNHKEEPEKVETNEEYIEEEVNLEEMTKAELIELAKEHDIEVNEKDTKSVIIEAITKAFE
ncbi:Rho termination factor N-terminal domain-containing protein [Gracilibacillus dipsosauri]|uniref:Rho termination factor N-terminal domain-containing protein n=1 Tax=Gracilibacillus dipsosauri TaxID=178340 RepID=UPI00240939EE